MDAAIRTAPHLEKDNHSLLLAAIGIAGEAIEVFEVAQQEVVSRPKLVKELGDVCWYTALACHNINVDFADLCSADKVVNFWAAGFGDRYKALDAHIGVMLIAAKNVSEFLKKQVFHHHPEDNQQLTLLLMRLVQSIQVVGAWAGYDIDVILTMNIDKLKARYPDRFNPEKSMTKDESLEDLAIRSLNREGD